MGSKELSVHFKIKLPDQEELRLEKEKARKMLLYVEKRREELEEIEAAIARILEADFVSISYNEYADPPMEIEAHWHIKASEQKAEK